MRTSKEMPCHIGLHVKLYPSNKQKHIITVNDGAQRSVYNRLVAAGNERFRVCGNLALGGYRACHQ